MKIRPALTLLFVLVLGVAAGGRAAAAVAPAPAPLAPAFGANVLVPFTISWSAVSDPSGIVAYNWQVSSSSTFTPVIHARDSPKLDQRRDAGHRQWSRERHLFLARPGGERGVRPGGVVAGTELQRHGRGRRRPRPLDEIGRAHV